MRLYVLRLLALAFITLNFGFAHQNLSALTPPVLEVVFFDAGEGDASLIRYPGGKTILIDTGNMVTGVSIYQQLDGLGVDRLNHLILTHPHLDHIGGSFLIFHVMRVDAVHDNGQILPDYMILQDAYRWYSESIRSSKRYARMTQSDTIVLAQDCSLKVLWPVKDQWQEDINANSLVLLLRYGQFTVLFMGDANTISERRLLKSDIASQIKNIDILKVGHHGAHDATSEAFLKHVNPRIAIVSVNKDNIRGYPSPEVISRLQKQSKVYLTYQTGNIQLKGQLDGKYDLLP